MQCPHCLKHFHESWTYKSVVNEKNKIWGIGSTICAACGRPILALGELVRIQGPAGLDLVPNTPTFFFAYPKAISRSPLPPEVPPEFAADYLEACLVLPDSEKASAALSRRCLQHLLREQVGVKKDDLAKEIQHVLDSKQLPGHLAEDLDAIRHIGNFAAHPMKATHSGVILDVEPHEAEWLLNLLEGLFDFYLVQPARAKAKRDAMLGYKSLVSRR
jgi:hypothetical protein